MEANPTIPRQAKMAVNYNLANIRILLTEGFSDAELRDFLCHASADKSPVRELYQRLRADGFDPWLDAENLLPGQKRPSVSG